MNIYAARQPIFTRKEEVFGYELLHRKTEENRFMGTDHTEATAELINNTFLSIGIQEYSSNKRLFINFSRDLIVSKVPMLLPKELIVVEILEDVEIDKELVEACQELKEAGYLLALDDFVFREGYEELIPLASIIKTEYGSYSPAEHQKLVQQYGNKILLVERVETREEFEELVGYGYHLFQGFFFSKPIMMKGKEVPPFNPVLLQVIEELNKEDPRYDLIAQKIENDLSLTYKFLKLANTIQFGSKFPVDTAKEAMVRIGLESIRKWIYILMLQDIKFNQNSEMITNSLIRAKMMEMIAEHQKNKKSHFFLAGLFSELDAITGKPFEILAEELPLSPEVEKALLRKGGKVMEMLYYILNFEKGKLVSRDYVLKNGKEELNLSDVYQYSIEWSNKLLELK
ncbi:diguanylate phosphodiesterase [Tindallia magadiensis]|uniref:Diguanylate phosphodiesterase n=1 Tax=Tindallia magadiensis TaxID=69895 RepID=A0A1I3CUU9_9FIRM|nr:HDOD domain-containing protein [Tindallia magadiensis]SFH78136.1 diguanylate phosphodiesterase [Tindallia magadiensis]